MKLCFIIVTKSLPQSQKDTEDTEDIENQPAEDTFNNDNYDLLIGPDKKEADNLTTPPLAPVRQDPSTISLPNSTLHYNTSP